MSCCNKPTQMVRSNTPVIPLKDLDLWSFRGFSGLINLFTKRLVQNPNPLSKSHLALLGLLIERLENTWQNLDALPERDLTQQESDELLLSCLGKLCYIVATRVKDGPQYKDVATSQLLLNEIGKLKSLLGAYEQADFRAANPLEQGRRDRAQNWSNRGGSLYQHDFEVREYDKGYEN